MARIALLGSAPSSLGLAPYADPSWQIWACSPGTYYQLPRCEAFFELHRWEPGVIGKPATQKPWFSPEYVAWMGKQRLVWMIQPVSEIPGSRALPFEAMNKRWGSYFWTSSLAYMLAMALDVIIAERAFRKVSGMSEDDQTKAALNDAIGLWGVDMAATEEYGYQRAGCQHFICEANRLGILVLVPPESDLLRPMPPYGLFEATHFAIKSLVRENELKGREHGLIANIQNLTNELHFVRGALDNHRYHQMTWGDDRDGLASHPEIARLQAEPIAQEAQESMPASPPAPAGMSSTIGSLEAAISDPTATVVALRPAPAAEASKVP